MPKLTIQKLTFKDPKWSKPSAKAGEEIELEVTAPKIGDKQEIEFRISDADKQQIAVVKAKSKETKAKWVVPNIPGETKVRFEALLCEQPSPQNGHQGVLSRLDPSDELTIKGYKVEITKIDAAFVPKQEKLEVKYKIEDPAGAAKKGRYEIWGERYPTDKPLYATDFTPSTGDTTWHDWDGKANEDGVLKNKYLTPEFSPYRMRVIIGPDEDSVKEPYGKGLGKVGVAEKQFEVTFQSVRIRLQADLEGAVQTSLDKMLVVENRTAKGVYAHKGRPPLETEPALANNWAPGEGPVAKRPGVGRIRIPCVRHTIIGESLGQGSSALGNPPGGGKKCRVADSYKSANKIPPGGAAQTKYDIDKAIYTRPEIPLEIEPRLKSRDPQDDEARDFGLFEKEAVGPVIYDVNAGGPVFFDNDAKTVKDAYPEDLYTTVVPATSRAYFKNADHRIKRGKHDAPQDDSTSHTPIFSYWQARFKVAGDGDREFDVSTFDAAFSYTVRTDKTQESELTVYLNHARLKVEDDSHKNDFEEVDTKKIKLRKGLTKKDDILWIVRSDVAASGSDEVATWKNYPPGANCHVHYGGIRGKAPTDDLVGTLRKDFSSGASGSEPIFGKGTKAFPYKKYIDLDPSKVAVGKRERVESQAFTADEDQKGLAGILFSPSVVGGGHLRRGDQDARVPVCPRPGLRHGPTGYPLGQRAHRCHERLAAQYAQ